MLGAQAGRVAREVDDGRCDAPVLPSNLEHEEVGIDGPVGHDTDHRLAFGVGVAAIHGDRVLSATDMERRRGHLLGRVACRLCDARDGHLDVGSLVL